MVEIRDRLRLASILLPSSLGLLHIFNRLLWLVRQLLSINSSPCRVRHPTLLLVSVSLESNPRSVLQNRRLSSRTRIHFHLWCQNLYIYCIVFLRDDLIFYAVCSHLRCDQLGIMIRSLFSLVDLRNSPQLSSFSSLFFLWVLNQMAENISSLFYLRHYFLTLLPNAI